MNIVISPPKVAFLVHEFPVKFGMLKVSKGRLYAFSQALTPDIQAFAYFACADLYHT